MPEINLNGYIFDAEHVEKYNMRFFCTLDGISIWVHDNPSTKNVPNTDQVREKHRFCRWNGPVSQEVWELQIDRNRKEFDHIITFPGNVEAIKGWAGGRAVFNLISGGPDPNCPYCQGTGKVMMLITSIQCPDCCPKEKE
jgi:hypothetical protein